MTMCFKTLRYSVLEDHLLGELADSYDYTFFRHSYLTAKTLHSTTMRGFLVGATVPKKRTLKRVQLRFLG